MKAQLAMAENQVRSEVQTVAHLKARKLAILKLLAIYAPYMVADGDPFDDAEKDPKTLCNELLYGKAGYLYSLAFVVDMLRNRPILINGQEDKTATGLITDVQVVMKQVLKAILKEGRRSVTKHKADFSNVPEHYLPCYIWNWHNKPYLGGAHGLCGILNVLLLDEVRSMLPPGTIKKIKQTLVFLLACKLPSGNYPSRHNKPVANGDSDLVQWCHGPTSVALLLCRAAQLPEFVDEKEIYLRVATSAADVIWERGLLRKGVGMCHGISGNAMPFLALYQATGNKQFLYKAGVFADFMLNNAEVTLEAPSDSPYSYSGGLVGAALFLSSLLIPSAAKFPGWDI
jgi:hypothetical protein